MRLSSDVETNTAAGESAERLIAAAEGVVPSAAHIEVLVADLRGIVVVADRRLESHAGVQQCFIGPLELGGVVLGRVPVVDVVTHHQDEVERESGAPRHELLGDLVLKLVSPAGIADHRELQ